MKNILTIILLFFQFQLSAQKYFFLLLLSLTFSLKTEAQNYVPFPSGQASWSVEQEDFNWMIPNTCALYYFDGDTTINSLIYHKVNTSYDSVPPSG